MGYGCNYSILKMWGTLDPPNEDVILGYFTENLMQATHKNVNELIFLFHSFVGTVYMFNHIYVSTPNTQQELQGNMHQKY